MTQKYLWVRREVYEHNPARTISSKRSFSDMVKLFKRSYWFMLIIFALSLIGTLVILIFAPKNLSILLPIITMIIVYLVSQIPREKYLYNDSVRNEELAEMQGKYQLHIEEIWTLLKKHSINTPEMVSQLKLECEESLKTHNEKYHGISNSVFDMFIGVPLGALIASIIYADSSVIQTAIASIIIIGFAASGLIRLIRYVCFYTEGYFKDKYLLNALNELSYFENLHKSDNI